MVLKKGQKIMFSFFITMILQIKPISAWFVGTGAELDVTLKCWLFTFDTGTTLLSHRNSRDCTPDLSQGTGIIQFLKTSIRLLSASTISRNGTGWYKPKSKLKQKQKLNPNPKLQPMLLLWNIHSCATPLEKLNMSWKIPLEQLKYLWNSYNHVHCF